MKMRWYDWIGFALVWSLPVVLWAVRRWRERERERVRRLFRLD